MTKRKMTFCHFSFGHCIGSHSSTYGIRLPLLSFFFWSLYWLSFFDLQHQIAPLVIFLLVIVLVVIQWPKEKWQKGQSDVVGQRMTTNTMTKRKMTKGAIWLSFFFWSLYWLSFFDLRHQIAPLVIFLLVIVLVVILRPKKNDKRGNLML
jgi:preprotein translocase subunit SecG